MKCGMRFGLPEKTLMPALTFSFFQAATWLRWLLPVVLVACAQIPSTPIQANAQTLPANALSEPLDDSAAVQLALHHSPAFQALLNLHQAQLSDANHRLPIERKAEA